MSVVASLVKEGLRESYTRGQQRVSRGVVHRADPEGLCCSDSEVDTVSPVPTLLLVGEIVGFFE